MLPEVHVLGLDVQMFGVLVLLGFAASIAVLTRYARERGVPERWALEGVVVAMAGGLVGARLWFVVEHGGEAVGGDGLVWYGGLVGGAVAVAAYLAVRGIPLLLACDAAALALAAGQAIGRWACQFAGDGDYGTASSLPWAMGYPDGTIPTPPGVEVHPTPIYESLALGLLFVVLWRFRTRLQGLLLPLYLVGAGAQRFLVEFLRRNDEVAAGLTAAQLVSLALLAAGLAWLTLARRPAVV